MKSLLACLRRSKEVSAGGVSEQREEMRSGRPAGLRSWAMWSALETLDLFYVQWEDIEN